MQKIIIILVCLFTLVGCQRNKNKGKNKNTLVYPLSDEISTLDPANSYDVISATVIYQAYEQLYEYHYLKRPYTLQPLLAESMPTITKNGTRYTIKIKKGIQYQDDPAFAGKPRFVKAQDFITQIKRLAYSPTKSNGWWLFDGRIKGINAFRKSVKGDLDKFFTTKVEGLTAPNDQTLVIDLVRPYPQMLFALSMSFTSPVPEEVVRKYNNQLHDKIVGTGPYMLEKWERRQRIRLIKSPTFRKEFYPTEGDRFANSKGLLKDAGKQMPFLDSIEFTIIKEAQTRWFNFRKKIIDILPHIPKDNFDIAIDSTGKLAPEMGKEKIQISVSPTLTYWWISFNMEDPLLGKNKNLRLAIAHAIDTDKFIKTFTSNTGQKANSIYPPGIPGYDPSSQLSHEYNLEKAKEYLAKAGYPDGKGLPTLKYDDRGDSATNRQQAEFFKTQLRKIGINIETNLNPFPVFLQKSKKGELQLWQDGWVLDYPDAENVLQLLSSQNHPPGPNVTFYRNPKFDDYFEKIKSLNEGPEKWSLMKKAEQLILDDLPWSMLYYRRRYILFHGHVKNYRHSDVIYNFMKYMKKD
jgi:ABC-type transport system substrate-binding protein